jgi:hypothetical protein
MDPRSQLNESFADPKRPLHLIVIGSNTHLLPPQSVTPLTASLGLSQFVRAALARYFADGVRSLQSTPPSLCSPIDHSTFAAEFCFDV